MSDLEMAQRMRRQARLMRALNVLMRRLLALPFRTPLSRRLMLLTVTGRVTGRRYRQPVSYIRNGETLLTPGGGKWTRNLRPDQAITIRLEGRDRHARPDLVTDAALVTELLDMMVKGNSQIARFVPFIDRRGNFDQARLMIALQHGFCIVRWHLI